MPDLDVTNITMFIALIKTNGGKNSSGLVSLMGMLGHNYEQNVTLKSPGDGSGDCFFEYDGEQGTAFNFPDDTAKICAMRYDGQTQILSSWYNSSKLADVTNISPLTDPMTSLVITGQQFEGQFPNRTTGADIFEIAVHQSALPDSDISSEIQRIAQKYNISI